MGSKIIKLNDDARSAVRRGIDTVADTVKVTLGPTGRNVLLRTPWGSVVMTKDGATVARDLTPADPFEALGAQFVKEAAMTTNSRAGDGTTTATVLTQAMIREGEKRLDDSTNVTRLRRGLEAAAAVAIESIRRSTTVVDISDGDRLRQIATISGNDPDVGRIVVDAFQRVGVDGVVTFEETSELQTSIQYHEGMKFDRGFLSGLFVNDTARIVCRLENPYILFWGGKIEKAEDIVPLLEYCATHSHQLLIIAEDVSGDALMFASVNSGHGVLRCCAVKAPDYGERQRFRMTDMARVCGGEYVTPEMGASLKKLDTFLPKLGKAEKVTVGRYETVIQNGGASEEDVAAYIELLKLQMASLEDPADRDKYVERIAKISNGVAVIRIGGSSAAEVGEKKFRFEDAINAVRCALEEGFVPGGGLALLQARTDVKKFYSKLPVESPERVGAEIVDRALYEPFRLIVSNAGCSVDDVYDRWRRSRGVKGLDARTGKIVDIVEAGVIDPAKVVTSAVLSSSSVAASFLTLEAVVVDTPKKDNHEQP